MKKTKKYVEYVYKICNYIIIYADHANNILVFLLKFKGKVQQFKKSLFFLKNSLFDGRSLS